MTARTIRISIAAGLAALWLAAGCDRNTEPFDPNERPQAPDLSKIFPAGADRAKTANQNAPTPEGGRGAPPLATPGASPISGKVTLAGEVAGRVPSGAVLFLIARAAADAPPLAVVRIPTPSFPLDFVIGPENRMLQSVPFEGSLRLTARVDADGNAMTRDPGDLFGAAEGRYDPGDRGVAITIDEVL